MAPKKAKGSRRSAKPTKRRRPERFSLEEEAATTMAAPRDEAGGTTDGGVERARGQRGPSTGKPPAAVVGFYPEPRNPIRGASRERRTSRGVDAHRVIRREPR